MRLPQAIAVRRDDNRNVVATIEFMKDGIGEGDSYVSSLIGVDLCEDEDGDIISSCVIVETMEFLTSSKAVDRAKEQRLPCARFAKQLLRTMRPYPKRCGLGELMPCALLNEQPEFDARFISTGAQVVDC